MAQEIRLYWSRRATLHINDIYQKVSKHDLAAAERLVARLVKLTEALYVSPEIGRMVPEIQRSDVRERIHKNYRLVYRVHPGEVEIVAVWHTSREKLPEL